MYRDNVIEALSGDILAMGRQPRAYKAKRPTISKVRRARLEKLTRYAIRAKYGKNRPPIEEK